MDGICNLRHCGFGWKSLTVPSTSSASYSLILSRSQSLRFLSLHLQPSLNPYLSFYYFFVLAHVSHSQFPCQLARHTFSRFTHFHITAIPSCPISLISSLSMDSQFTSHAPPWPSSLISQPFPHPIYHSTWHLCACPTLYMFALSLLDTTVYCICTNEPTSFLHIITCIGIIPLSRIQSI